MKNWLFLILFVLTTLSYSQTSSSTLPKRKYVRFLADDSLAHSSFINVNANYIVIPKRKNFTASGFNASLGINLARFFTKKIILGLSLDYKGFYGNSEQSFSDHFKQIFNENFIPVQANYEDSAVVYALKGAINGEEGYKARGNTFFNYGICFSPLPHKYGGIIIEAKTGYRIFTITSPYIKDELYDGENRYVNLHLKHNYSIVIGCNPYKFLNKPRISFASSKFKDLWKFLSVRFYYERLSFKNSEFHNVPINKIVTDNFFKSYGTVDNFGFAVGLSFY